MSHSPGFLALVEKALEQVKEIEISEAKDFLAQHPDCIVMDVREDNEWLAGFIPGAMHLGKGVIERDIETIVPDKTQEILLYCGSGYRSVLAAASLQAMGYTQCWSLRGGIRGWLRLGYALAQ